MNRTELMDELFDGISDEHLAAVLKSLEPPDSDFSRESESYRRLVALGCAIAEQVDHTFRDRSDYDSWPE